ncbi:MAG: IPT/TIG domain-containing protein [Bacteroidota bacterium]
MHTSIKIILLLVITGSLLFSCSKSGNDTSTGGGTTGGNTSKLKIDSISPASGIAGTQVTIYGKGFSTTASSDIVTVNGKTVTVTDAELQTLRFTVPAGLGSGVVTVQVGSDKATGPAFTYVPAALISILAGGGSQGNSDGQGLSAQFQFVRALAIDTLDNLFIVDQYRIRKVTSNGTVSTLAGIGTGQYLDGPAASAKFVGPEGITVNHAGDHIYVTDNGAIRLITGGNVSTYAGNHNTGGGAVTLGYMDGGQATALFNLPIGIWLDNKANQLYVADWANLRIRAIDGSQNTTTIAGNGTYGALDGTGVSAEFGNLQFITGDGNGHLFVTESGGGNGGGFPADAGHPPLYGIRRVLTSGKVTTLTGKTTSGDADGDTTAATFSSAGSDDMGIAIDGAGKTLYVTGKGIRKVDLQTGQVTTLQLAVDQSAPGASLVTSLFSFSGIVIDSHGNLIVTDGDWIYKITLGQ